MATNPPALSRPGLPATKASGHIAFVGSANFEGEPGRVAIIKESAAQGPSGHTIAPEEVARLPRVKVKWGHAEHAAR